MSLWLFNVVVLVFVCRVVFCRFLFDVCLLGLVGCRLVVWVVRTCLFLLVFSWIPEMVGCFRVVFCVSFVCLKVGIVWLIGGFWLS